MARHISTEPMHRMFPRYMFAVFLEGGTSAYKVSLKLQKVFFRGLEIRRLEREKESSFNSVLECLEG